MGGIICATPAESVTIPGKIKKLKRLPPASEIGSYGYWDIEVFKKLPNCKGLKNVSVQHLNFDQKLYVNFSSLDMTWLFGQYFKSKNFPEWSGFMELYTEESSYCISKIIPTSFVNSPASDYNTIFTVLRQANLQCEVSKQGHIFVSFDQPLYHKACEVSECLKGTPHELKHVIVRLGGFHALMSYLGAIGHIYDSSGLKEAFCQVYAPISSDNALSGKAYARSVRGHLLTQNALAEIIMSQVNLEEDERLFLVQFYSEVNRENFAKFTTDEKFLNIKEKFTKFTVDLKQRSPTARYWVQYFFMVELIKNFVQAERTANWDMHLQTLYEMLPFYHASGHNNYAKSVHLYLQEMSDLKKV